MSALLEIDDLKVQFNLFHGTAHALNGVNLSINRGEMLGLVGESGSGKSMTGLSIVGLVPRPGVVTGGKITFDGQDLLRLDQHHLRAIRGRRIAMVFQDPRASLNPVFTIGQQLATVYRVHRRASAREARRRTLEMIQSVEIPDAESRANAYPHELSGGMCQRVMLAMALICEPELLIADEPTTALDVTVQAQVLELLRELIRSAGTSCLFITHDLGVVARMCDRVAIMYAGRVVEVGRVTEVFPDPLHPYTRGLLASALRVDADPGGRLIGTIPGEVPDATSFPPGCPFHPRCPEADDRCQRELPESVREDGRQVACHRWSERRSLT